MGRKRKKMVEFNLDWISAVDRPAQEPALAAILKRESAVPKTEDRVAYIKRLLEEGKVDPKAKDAEVKKATALTTEMDGHTHLVHTGRYDGGEEKAGSTSWTDEHSHPWIRDNDGDVVIGAAEGHTHDVAIMTKKDPAEEAEMTKPDDTAKSAETIAKLEKRLATSEKLAALNDEHTAFYFKLDVEGQPAFLDKSETERQEAIDATKAEDPIVYKGADGSIFRKSDDVRLVQMAKDRDADRLALAKERATRRDAEYTKRAEDLFKRLPGEKPVQVALLRAVDEIRDEDTRTKALEILKAADNGLAEVFTERGVGGQGGEATAEQKLEKMARDLQGKETQLTYEQAYDKVLQTADGEKLYSEHVAANPTT